MKQPYVTRLSYCALFAGSLLLTTGLSSLNPSLSSTANASLQDSPKLLLDEAWQIVNREYVDLAFNQIDWEAVRHDLLDRTYGSREEAYNALRAALEQLNDPYTRFMDPEQYEQLTRQTSGELSGIGLRLQLEQETGKLVVVEPIPNSPAAAAGIRSGDYILEIDGQSTEGMTVEAASTLIRGEVGTRVTLRIDRNGEEILNLPLTRARIELPTVRHALRQENGTDIGYIRLGEFSSHAAEQMQHAIEQLEDQGAEAFVLDLRGNPGGLLYASIDISRMWIENGSIVRTVDRIGASEEIRANQTALTNLPLAVLVDGNSASSSEILTGALMDNHRATVVGSQTFGKALVQSVHSLSDGSGIAVTIAHYYTPNGTDISHLGLTPHVRIDLTQAQQEELALNPSLVGTIADPQYTGAIEVLQETVLANQNETRAAQPSEVDRGHRSLNTLFR
ncbi:MAG: PDZ domain-containing protein [Leptolyngbyaceae cyanobacterium SL_7_1]|nr:PDZ domain-containing protein [Leptolyngbyaceae cyanobacterium SL_7_1]